MAHIFDELVEMQKSADKARGRVLELRDTYGPPTTTPVATAGPSLRGGLAELAGPDRKVQEAITTHASKEGTPCCDVEAAVRAEARRPEPELASA
ncbi:hypothetical protein [Streptomyces sp. MUSC 14]|uniref:hypothetical protein n=1 Tax=Streptomyces sp. MUSC 14 TaxID=1354889 RepID=UPI00210A9085|nr:hypothetical protein [Streptomyces sp. MUSC 14]